MFVISRGSCNVVDASEMSKNVVNRDKASIGSSESSIALINSEMTSPKEITIVREVISETRQTFPVSISYHGRMKASAWSTPQTQCGSEAIQQAMCR